MNEFFPAVQIWPIAAFMSGSIMVWRAMWPRLRRGETLLAHEPRTAVPWRGSDVMLVFLLTMLIGAAPALVHELTHGSAEVSADETKVEESAALTPLLVLTNIGMSLATMAVSILVLWQTSGARWHDFGIARSEAPRGWLYDVAIGLAGTLAATPPVYAIFALLTLWVPSAHPLIKMVNEERGALTLAMSWLSAVVVAPFFEEFLFRVVLQGWLEKIEDENWTEVSAEWKFPPGFASLSLTSFVFAMIHWSHGPDPVPLFFLSLALGYLYRQTHRIWPSVVMHAAFNATGLFWLWLSAD